MDIQPIGGDAWLAVVNKECLPDKTAFTKKFYKLGEKFIVHVSSGYGNFISPLVDTEEELRLEDAKIDQQYNMAKGSDWTTLKSTAMNPIPSPF